MGCGCGGKQWTQPAAGEAPKLPPGPENPKYTWPPKRPVNGPSAQKT